MSRYDWEADDARVRMLTQRWGEEHAKRRERAARRTEKRVRKTMVERYLSALKIANDERYPIETRRSARYTLDHVATNLRDVERIAIDERLGISGVPTGIEGR